MIGLFLFEVTVQFSRQNIFLKRTKFEIIHSFFLFLIFFEDKKKPNNLLLGIKWFYFEEVTFHSLKMSSSKIWNVYNVNHIFNPESMLYIIFELFYEFRTL